MFFIRQVGAICLIVALLLGMVVSLASVCSASIYYQDLLNLSNANEDV